MFWLLHTGYMSRAGFKGELSGRSPWGLHKAEMKSTSFSIIMKSSFLFFIIINNNKIKELSQHKFVVTDKGLHIFIAPGRPQL
jgi:hypothetical protein